MIRKILSPCILIFVLASPTAFTAENPQPFSLSISVKEPIFKTGEPIHLHLTVTNVSSKEITLVESPGDPPPAEYQYSIDVRDPDGHAVRRTEFGEKLKHGLMSGSRVTRELQPGESYALDTELTKIFDLSRPGTLSVQVSRSVPRHLGKGILKSNTLSITIG